MKVQDYLDLGWSLIPVNPNTKAPAISWEKYQSERADKGQVMKWIEQKFSLGLVTGKLSGIDVVDDDRVKNGLGDWEVVSSVVLKTRSGGKHYYFRHTDGLQNTVNHDFHLDIRAEGGQVLVPPSPGYEWISPPTPENIAKLTVIPVDLLEMIKPTHDSGSVVNLAEIVGTEVGGRDNQLLRAANSLLNKYPEKDWGTVVYQLLSGVNKTFIPPLSETDVQRVFRQATNFVHNHPKTKPNYRVSNLTPFSTEAIAAQRAKDREVEALAPSTGYEDLDRCYRPLVPGRLSVLTGDTNIGKTAFMCNLTHRVTQQGKSVLYFALEPDRTLIDYLVTIKEQKLFAEVTNHDIAGYKNPYLKIFGADQVRTLADLLGAVRSLSRYDVVIVDHIGYFAETNTGNFTAEQGQTLRQLALLAQEKMTHIMTIAHLNKTFDCSPKKWIPTMNQISGTAGFKQDCDDVLILARKPIETEWHTFDYDSSDEGVIVVGKSKSKKGQTIAPLKFHQNSGLITGRNEAMPSELERKQLAWLSK